MYNITKITFNKLQLKTMHTKLKAWNTVFHEVVYDITIKLQMLWNSNELKPKDNFTITEIVMLNQSITHIKNNILDNKYGIIYTILQQCCDILKAILEN